MATTTTRPKYPETARSHYLLSALVAQRAAAEAFKVRANPVRVVDRIIRHQIAQANLSERAVADILTEQDIDAEAEALLNSAAFTTDTQALLAMIDATLESDLERLAESLVQDAGRAAESVATTARPNVAHVRFLSPPSCSRCAVLAGRTYRWSDGFLRHPNCDCVMVPTTVANPLVQDVEGLVEDGQVAGLSKADMKAIRDGADVSQVVNVRRSSAGLQQSGRTLSRAGRPTPEGIYAMASTREEAVGLLAQYGYLR